MNDSRENKYLGLIVLVIVVILVGPSFYNRIMPFIFKIIHNTIKICSNFGLTMDGILTAIVATVGAIFVYRQIRQKSEQIVFERFRSRIIYAATNILFCGSYEGFVMYNKKNIRYVVAWRADRKSEGLQGEEIANINIMFRVIYKNEDYKYVLEQLCSFDSRDRWTYVISIPFFEGVFGEMIEASYKGATIEKMKKYECLCIGHALLNIQQIDCKDMLSHQDHLRATRMKTANDEYLKINLTNRHAIFKKSM